MQLPQTSAHLEDSLSFACSRSGAVHALRFRRQEEGCTKVDVWLDLDRNLLPARIYAVDRKGNVLDQVIREARLELAEETVKP